ncbi:hypothetical protein OIU77_002045 [Salix suchowensis]|uniref:Uncharacterized protein n=1 Tax=Salix suchowensis TaxID=1278906 RepID=A0ABQ9B5F3_9ROSI|nr:hypothetical protein OIU77_002045 [Salix suchowensis]
MTSVCLPSHELHFGLSEQSLPPESFKEKGRVTHVSFSVFLPTIVLKGKFQTLNFYPPKRNSSQNVFLEHNCGSATD